MLAPPPQRTCARWADEIRKSGRRTDTKALGETHCGSFLLPKCFHKWRGPRRDAQLGKAGVWAGCREEMWNGGAHREVNLQFYFIFFNDEKKLLRANGIGWITDGQNGTRICKPHQRDAVPSSMWAVLSTLKEKWEILIFSLCEKWHHYPCVWEADFIPNNIILPESFQALRWIFFSEPLPFCISQCTADVNRHGTSQPGTISSPAVGQRLCHVCRAIWHILSLTQQIRSAS